MLCAQELLTHDERGGYLRVESSVPTTSELKALAASVANCLAGQQRGAHRLVIPDRLRTQPRTMTDLLRPSRPQDTTETEPWPRHPWQWCWGELG